MQRISPSERKNQALRKMFDEGYEEGTDRELMLSELIRLTTEKTLQEILKQEQSERLGRARYERRDGPSETHRNGYEPGTLKSAEGVLRLQLPQIRGGEEPYRSKLWSKLSNTSEALKDLVVEMYIHGMSQRDIEQALEKALGQFVLSKSSVSEISESLSEDYEAFKSRDLSGFDVAYVFLDAVYEPLRRYGCSTGVLRCWGICSDGSRVLLDLTLANNESQAAVTEFLHGMIRRGLQAPLTMTSDGAPGLISALQTTSPRALRVRCWFHKMQSLKQKVPPDQWAALRSLILDMRDAPDLETANQRLDEILKNHSTQFPELCRCLKDDREASLNHLQVAYRHRRHVRTVNLVERSFVEQRRRTKVIPHLWHEKQLTKLVFAVLIRLSDRWSRRQFSEIEQQQIQQLRSQMYPDEKHIEQPKETQKIRRSAARVA